MDIQTWTSLVDGLGSTDIDTCVDAAQRLHSECTMDDIPRLIALLDDSADFFCREAAAWPLAELAGPAVLPQLLTAYQRGFDEGHDNDGFTAALLEIPALFGDEARRTIAAFIERSEEPLKGHATWLLSFCQVQET